MSAATEIVSRVEHTFNAGDVGAFARCFAQDTVQVHPFFPEPHQGARRHPERRGGDVRRRRGSRAVMHTASQASGHDDHRNEPTPTRHLG